MMISWTTTKVFLLRTVTEQLKMASLPLNFSLTRGSHFLALFIGREHDAGSFFDKRMWSFLMMETHCDFEGIFTSMAVSENIYIL